MTRITPDHLARGAFIYVRQSTSDQVLHNHESRRRQYGLVDRARALGWAVVDNAACAVNHNFPICRASSLARLNKTPEEA
jgi:hypothetical protein